MSPLIVDGILKRALGFTGVVISDDLGMKAIAATTSLPDATVEALAAGCDAVLLCNSSTDEQVMAIEAIIRAAESGALTQTRVDDALERQHRVKGRLLTAVPQDTPLALVGCAAHQAVAREMAAWL
jgi:beta-N-acetylhexosaminidase